MKKADALEEIDKRIIAAKSKKITPELRKLEQMRRFILSQDGDELKNELSK